MSDSGVSPAATEPAPLADGSAPDLGLGWESTASDVMTGVDLSGRRAVVTGGAAGIGREISRALASGGAEVTMAVRRVADAEVVAAEIGAETGAEVRVTALDLSDRPSIATFVQGWRGQLDILVNNAGVMAIPELRLTESGWEEQLAVNHLGPAELTLGLGDALAAAGGARVVNVSSSAHLMSPVDLADPHFASQSYDPWIAYARSKTASILFTVALAARWKQRGIAVNAAHPGRIMTGLMRHLDEQQLAFVGGADADPHSRGQASGWKTVGQGAATAVLLAASPAADHVTGRYFENCRQAEVQAAPVPGGPGVAWWAVDPPTVERLWEQTRQLLEA